MPPSGTAKNTAALTLTVLPAPTYTLTPDEDFVVDRIGSLVVGVGVTVFAAVFPSLRASRVPPLAASIEGDTDPQYNQGQVICRENSSHD